MHYIVSIEELSGLSVITCIQKDSNNDTRWEYQSNKTEVLEKLGIKNTVRKNTKTSPTSEGMDRNEASTSIKLCNNHTMSMCFKLKNRT